MRKRLIQVLGTCLTLAIFAAIVLSHHPAEASHLKTAALHDEMVSKSIRLVLAQYTTSMVGGDVDGWLSLWDDEATWLPSSGAASIGKLSIELTVRRALQRNPVSGMSMFVRDVSTEGSLAVAVGEFTESTGPLAAGGSSEGKFLMVFRKQLDGTWKIFRSCFIFDVPRASGLPSRT